MCCSDLRKQDVCLCVCVVSHLSHMPLTVCFSEGLGKLSRTHLRCLISCGGGQEEEGGRYGNRITGTRRDSSLLLLHSLSLWFSTVFFLLFCPASFCVCLCCLVSCSGGYTQSSLPLLLHSLPLCFLCFFHCFLIFPGVCVCVCVPHFL